MLRAASTGPAPHRVHLETARPADVTKGFHLRHLTHCMNPECFTRSTPPKILHVPDAAWFNPPQPGWARRATPTGLKILVHRRGEAEDLSGDTRKCPGRVTCP